MILVDPVRVIIGSGLISLAMFMAGFWIGRRFGFSEGFAAWQKSYQHMTSKEIAEPKNIIG